MPGLQSLGMVAIGRNEGERLLRCFDSLPRSMRHVVYVDSGSSDDSVEQARRRGIDVIQLDMSRPFTAARARNAGLRRLCERWPGLLFAQFLDGDCALAPGWLEAAVRELESEPRLALVCGRRREIHPDASIYNRLADMEWNTPVGEVESSGGDALARIAALAEVGGYADGVMAGEEPEMCARLRARGWRIRRMDHEMTLHDAAMTRFGQWWRRSVRSGYGCAELAAMHPGMLARERRSSLLWGLAVPGAAALMAPAGGLGLILLLGYPALGVRILVRRRSRGDRLRDAALYANFCMLGKFPEVAGHAKYWWDRVRGRKGKLIEYK
ncbi:MAG TPA: glycosyltransferase [Anaeromyxobacteraceae bacterium]|nr:glycosyltransferase [Anaeromyxobacteraceae bacterium]